LHVNANANNSLNLRQIFNLAQENLSNRLKGLLRPGEEPINGTAVDERREHAETSLEVVTDRTHGKAQVNVVPGVLDEQVVNLVVVVRDSLEVRVQFVGFLNRLNDVDVVFLVVQVGNFTIVENVINVFNECFVDNLSVREEEDVGETFIS